MFINDDIDASVTIVDVLHVLEDCDMFLREHAALEAEFGVRISGRHFPEILDDAHKKAHVVTSESTGCVGHELAITVRQSRVKDQRALSGVDVQSVCRLNFRNTRHFALRPRDEYPPDKTASRFDSAATAGHKKVRLTLSLWLHREINLK
ncbi:hypothetical protein EVAR_95588_1 [Eumeta japonica]|uniref:Uncharacterized protein n=1 Tax=Eumeta variegata TaxID=151549 RepID=A0A4C1VK34_EUMVA|nr:hypothetical protein EVAR_95588_1 [Eumeta japonica]